MKGGEKVKKLIYVYASLAALVLVVAGVTYAAFSDKGNVLGSTFSVGSADIKLLNDITQGLGEGNLVEEKAGPNFNNISPFWTKDYLMKIYNNAATQISLSSNSNYETANDPMELRQIIFVEPFEWNDNNSDGVLDAGELGTSYGRKTIVKWKTEGFNLGSVDAGAVKSLVLRFSTDAVSDTKQGASALFDFQFSSLGL